MRRYLLALLCVLLLPLSACGPDSSSDPNAVPQVTPAPTSAPIPASTPTSTPPLGGPESACSPTQREIEVVYKGKSDIWLGTVGGAIRAQCVVTNPDNSLTVCIPPANDFNATSCDCGSGNLNGTLACPGSSVPTDGGKLCSAAGGKNCGVNAFPDPQAGSNQNDCYYTFPQPAQVYAGGKQGTPATWNWGMGTNSKYGITKAIFCFAPPTITYNGKLIPSGVSASGGIFARTGCLTGARGGTECAEGDCSPPPTAAPSSTAVPTPVPNAQCVPGVGPGNPAAQVEFTLQSKATDFYDVTLINGANATIRMKPIGVPTARPSSVLPDYWCEAPGAQTGNKACDWKFAKYINTSNVPLPPSPPTLASPTPTPTGNPTPAPTPDPLSLLIHSVRNCNTNKDCPKNWSCTGNKPHGICAPNTTTTTKPPLIEYECKTDADCKGQGGHCLPVGNQVGDPIYVCQCVSSSDCAGTKYPYCGEQNVGFSGGQLFLTECGKFGGWWTADDLCGLSPSATLGQIIGPLNCGDQIVQANSSDTTLRSLFGCIDQNAASCYDAGANDSCCGCATDPNNPLYNGTRLSSLWPQDPAGDCSNTNDTWADQIQPWLTHLKQACPTAYTYPYDDKTSTFQCQNGTLNTMAYKVTIGELPTPPRPTPTP